MIRIRYLKFLRLCFIVLFGAMSLMHGPVMAFGTAHGEALSQASHDCDHGSSGPAPHRDGTMCNSFACFLAVDPVVLSPRVPCALPRAVEPLPGAAALLPAITYPDTPPPRLQS